MIVEKYFGQKVVILGAARQGTALARYLVRYGARVVLNDNRQAEELQAAREMLADLSTQGKIEWVFGGHSLSLLEGADLICVSGGVPLTLPVIVAAQQRGLPITNDAQIFLEAAPCKVIGITGSAGKTTTTTLVGRMAEEAFRISNLEFRTRNPKSEIRNPGVWIGGNIGTPLISSVDEMQPKDLAVMELSSFQLELMTRSPQVAAVLNLTPNHLDRHGTMAAYTAAKARILEFQGPDSAAVLGREDPGSWGLREKVRGRRLSFGLDEPAAGQEGTFARGDDLYLRLAEQVRKGSEAQRRRGAEERPNASPADIYLMSRNDIELRGEHNLRNILAAGAIAAAAGLPVEAIHSGVKGFGGVPHRLEFVRTWGGADWYNDSIGTAPERAMAAIRSFDEPLVLLAGGRDKELPWEAFGALVRQRVDHLILFGEAAEKIYAAVRASGDKTRRSGAGGSEESSLAKPEKDNQPYTISICGNLQEAVEEAAQIVQPGDVVLLSPGGSSFDEFADFEERGEWFKKLVTHL